MMRKAAKSNLVALASAMAVVLLPDVMNAQTAPLASADASAPTGQEGTGLQEVVVTAQKRSEHVEQIPFAVDVVSGAALSAAQVTDTRDLSAVIPGLTFGMNGQFGRPAIRGVYSDSGSIGTEGGVAFYIDGVYRPNPMANVGELGDVERIEVLKGPQGTLFGRNATGGAIEIVTKEPDMTGTTGNFDASTSFFATQGVTGTMKGFFSGPLVQDKLAFSLAAEVSTNTGWEKDSVTNSEYGAVQDYMTRGKLRYAPTDDLTIELTGYITRRNDEYTQGGIPLNGNTAGLKLPPYNGSILPQSPWEVAYTPGWLPIARDEDQGASVKIAYDTPLGTLTSLSSWEFVTDLYTADIDVSSANVDQGQFLQDERPISEDLSFSSKPGWLTYVAGLYYFGDRVRQDSTTLVYAQQDATAYAVYAEGTLKLTDQLSIVGGARYNSEKKCGYAESFNPMIPFYEFPNTANITKLGCTTWPATTPRVSLRYAPTETVNLYATYSQGFKSGYYAVSAKQATPAKPETVTGYETGVKVNQGSYRFDFDVFYNKLKDKQVILYNGIAQAVSNAAAAISEGAEFNGDWNVTSAFNLQGGVTYMPRAKFTDYKNAVVNVPNYDCPGLAPCGNVAETRDETGARLLWSPVLAGNVTGAYDWNLAPGDVRLSMTANYSSKVDWEITGRINQPAFWLLSGELSYQPRGAPYRLSIWGKNLTNKVYIYGQSLNTFADYVNIAPPRELGASLHYEF